MIVLGDDEGGDVFGGYGDDFSNGVKMVMVLRVLMVVCEEDFGVCSVKKVVELCSFGSEDISVFVMIVKFVGILGIYGSVNVYNVGDSNNGGCWDNIFIVFVCEFIDWGWCLLIKKNWV